MLLTLAEAAGDDGGDDDVVADSLDLGASGEQREQRPFEAWKNNMMFVALCLVYLLHNPRSIHGPDCSCVPPRAPELARSARFDLSHATIHRPIPPDGHADGALVAYVLSVRSCTRTVRS